MTPDELLADLTARSIPLTVHHHPAVFTVAESASVKLAIPGLHTKNLFLKDRKGRLLLVTAAHATTIDLKSLGRLVGAAGRLSFGSPDLLRATLGVEPGSVTPLAIVNDRAGRVEVLLDPGLLRSERVNVHPLVNTMTVGLAPGDLRGFLESHRHPARIIELGGQNCVASREIPP